MGSTSFGNFFDFCRDTTLPICNLLSTSHNQTGPWTSSGCSLSGGPTLAGKVNNLSTIIPTFFSIFIILYLVWRTDRKRAAVGRREMQLFLIGFIIIEICEIFSDGGFPLNNRVRVVFSAIQIAMITAATWMLMLNAVVGYQIIDDGTPLSVGLLVASAAVLFIGTGYIALDTGLRWTDYWISSYDAPNRHIALYLLYFLFPLIFLVVYFVLETVIVIRVLQEIRPMFWLTGAALLFALGQIFEFVISKHICSGSNGRINGEFFEALFTTAAVVCTWIFWSCITEDDWAVGSSHS